MTTQELENKIFAGLKLSFEKLVKAKAKEDGILVFSENGKIVKIKAKDLERKLEAEKPWSF